MIGIYKITSPTNKIYIGQSINIKARWRMHHRGRSHKGKLKNSFKSHGVEAHIFEVLEKCDENSLNERERFYQDQYEACGPNGLNLILVSTDARSGKGDPSIYEKRKKTIKAKGEIAEKKRCQKIRSTIANKNKEEKEKISKRISKGVRDSNRIYIMSSLSRLTKLKSGKVPGFLKRKIAKQKLNESN